MYHMKTDLVIKVSSRISLENNHCVHLTESYTFLFLLLGMGGSVAFASPSRHLTFAHVCNQMDIGAMMMDARSIRLFQPIENILKEKQLP